MFELTTKIQTMTIIKILVIEKDNINAVESLFKNGVITETLWKIFYVCFSLFHLSSF